MAVNKSEFNTHVFLHGLNGCPCFQRPQNVASIAEAERSSQTFGAVDPRFTDNPASRSTELDSQHVPNYFRDLCGRANLTPCVSKSVRDYGRTDFTFFHICLFFTNGFGYVAQQTHAYCPHRPTWTEMEAVKKEFQFDRGRAAWP